MSQDRSKEQIKFFTEVFRLTWVSLIAVGGGTLSLVLGEPTGLKIVVAVLGFSALISLGVGLQTLQGYIRRLIVQIKED